jgi:hypothetical protein
VNKSTVFGGELLGEEIYKANGGRRPNASSTDEETGARAGFINTEISKCSQLLIRLIRI